MLVVYIASAEEGCGLFAHFLKRRKSNHRTHPEFFSEDDSHVHLFVISFTKKVGQSP